MPSLRTLVRWILAATLLAGACAHAPPVTGSRDPSAPLDPDYPDVNCSLYNTVDCRPGGTM